jgi:hypothetical protein
MNHELIKKIFATPIGTISCRLTSNKPYITLIENKTYENGQSEIFKTNAYQIELVEFKVRLPLYNGSILTDSRGWIWRIYKQQNNFENLHLDCELIEPTDDINYDFATGEHLDAIEASNKDWILHIGTEDGEVLNSRAAYNDWFPNRLQNTVDFYQSITEIKTNGFTTNIPNLRINEKIHIHYICAYDRRKNDPENINTWLAVDEYIRNLENWIGFRKE